MLDQRDYIINKHIFYSSLKPVCTVNDFDNEKLFKVSSVVDFTVIRFHFSELK